MAANYFKLGDKEKTVDMLQAAFEYAQRYEDRPDGAHYIPCWLSELDDKREYIGRYGKETLFDDLYSFIKEEPGLAESLKGSKRFNELMKKIKGLTNY